MKNKKVLLGITGSIAAYKIAFLTRLLIKEGAEVQILMTKAATDFITPLTLSTLSKKSVFTEVSSEESWNNHVDLGLWADVMLIAPATANTMAKLSNGLCDNIISACYLSARCPVFIAPAMDLDMWVHPSTQENVLRLEKHGANLIPVEDGELASGLVGKGRMAEPEHIVQYLKDHFNKKRDLAHKKVIVTAGPTYESIDPVRFIGNRSSGKMGLAISKSLAERRAKVVLILGPSKLDINHENVQLIRVETAQEMFDTALTEFETADAGVLAAAVADYRPAEVAVQKIKKRKDDMNIRLEKTPDIAAYLGSIKRDDQMLVGFALETNNELENAQGKLKRKNLDFIVLNSLRDKGAGFGHDTNKVTIIHANNKLEEFELKTKTEVAEDIVIAMSQYLLKEEEILKV